MTIDIDQLQENNQKDLKFHQEKYDFLANTLERNGYDAKK